MRWGAVLLWVGAGVGCSFHGASVTADASGGGADGDDDPIDAVVVPSICPIEVPGPTTVRGRLGGSEGGTDRPLLACASPAEVMVGVALLVSDGVAGGPQERSAQGIRIGCASITIDTTPIVGAVSTVEVEGDGGAGWEPSQWTGMTMCPTGSVIAGMQVHSGQYDAAFINASITCVELDTGAHTIVSQDVYVEGSLDEPLNVHTVRCDAGEVLAGAIPYTGAGLDSVELACAVPRCASL